MNWAEELRRAFERLDAGEAAQVEFAERDGFEGEMGRDFNDFAAEICGLAAGPLSREERHRLRNRLAGILAAAYVLRTGEETDLNAENLAALADAAKRIDARLCGDDS